MEHLMLCFRSLEIVRRWSRELAKTLKVQAILLYGSCAQNLQDKRSDVDLLIIVKKTPSPARRQALSDFLENFGDYV
jgi:predicted nucleotidyltransferase